MPSLFFPRRIPQTVRLLALALFSVLLSAFTQGQGDLRSMALDAALPVQWFNGRTAALWDEVWRNLHSRAALEAENARLRQALAAAQPLLLDRDILRSENRQLLALLDSFPQAPGRVMAARVIAENFTAGNQIITVDHGQNDGVFIGQAVLAAGGLAGQVVAVGTMTSQIALLSDLDSSVPAQSAENDQPLLVNGTGNPRVLQIPFQARNTPLRAGERLVTSGLGGRYPPGLPIGTIQSIRRNGTQAFADIQVRPAVALGRLNTVLLLWPQEGQPQAAKSP